MTVFLVIIGIALVAITLFAMHQAMVRKAHNAETERVNQERMACLRERKEQKKAEREAAAEVERLRQEELARQYEKEEEKKREMVVVEDLKIIPLMKTKKNPNKIIIEI